MAVDPSTQTYTPYRDEWLALVEEDVLEPELPIVDAHHHVWDLPRPRYMPRELIADVTSGHAITATVYVDCRSMYRADGPEHLRQVGEVEFANGVAAMGASGLYGTTRLCAAIVSNVDLSHSKARDTLEAMIIAGGGRFRGIRQVCSWDPDPAIIAPSAAKPRHLLSQPDFRRGFANIDDMGLSFDTFLYHHQLEDLVDLARDFPDTPIILNHIGAPLGIGRFSGMRQEVFDQWSNDMRRVAEHPNVHVKLGGLGMRMFGFGFDAGPVPPSSQQLADSWRPYVETCIEAFGPSRAMFESNFPPDKGSCSYKSLWNAFKRISAGFSHDEKSNLFSGTAKKVYKIPG